MEKNKKIVILAVVIIIALLVWIMPRGAGNRQLPPRQAPVSMQHPAPRIKTRSDFTDWGRNPFIWAGKVGPVSDLNLSGIIWDKAVPYAIINGMIVRVGDEISGKIIKDIEPNRVILTDGQNDYILELK